MNSLFRDVQNQRKSHFWRVRSLSFHRWAALTLGQFSTMRWHVFSICSYSFVDKIIYLRVSHTWIISQTETRIKIQNTQIIDWSLSHLQVGQTFFHFWFRREFIFFSLGVFKQQLWIYIRRHKTCFYHQPFCMSYGNKWTVCWLS